MGFRANVQRAGAKTTRYSGTANVSARKVPLGSASVTRAGEVVIKQGNTTTYIPPATFSGGKAAYKRYEAIRSVQGESAASQMAKEVAKGNMALRTIKPDVKGYEKSRIASVNYRSGVQARQQGIQTIQGSIGVNVSSGGGGQESVQLIQPSMQAERQRSSSPIFSSKNQSQEQPTGFSQPLSNEFLDLIRQKPVEAQEKYFDLIGQKPIVEKKSRFRLITVPEWIGGQPLPAGDETLLQLEGRKVLQGWDWLFNKSSRFGYTEEKESSLIQAKGEAEAESITNKYQDIMGVEQKKAEDVVKMAEERAKVNLYITDRKMREQTKAIDEQAEAKSQEVIGAYNKQNLGYKTANERLEDIYKKKRSAIGNLVLSSQDESAGIIKDYESKMKLYGEEWLPARQSRLQAGYEAELDVMSKKYQPYNETKIKEPVYEIGTYGVGKGIMGMPKIMSFKETTQEQVNPLYTEEKKNIRLAEGISKGDVFLGQYFRPAVSSLDPIAVASFVNPYTAVGYIVGRTIGTGGREVADMYKSFRREPLKTAAITGLSIAAYMGVGSVIAGSKGAFVKAGSKVKGWGIRNFFKEVKISKGRIVERTPAAYYNLPKNYAFITGKGRVPKLVIQELPKGFRISEAGSVIKGRGRLPASGNAIIYSQKVVQPSGSTLTSFIGWKASGKVLYAKSIGKVRPVFSDLTRRIPVKVRVVEPRITSYKIIKTPSGRATIPIRQKSAFIELKYSPKEFNARTWAMPEQTFWQKMGIKKLPAKTNEFYDMTGKAVKMKIPIDIRYFNSKSLLTGKQPSFALKFIREKPVNYRIINNRWGTALYKLPTKKAFSIKIKRPSAYQDYLQTKYVVFDVSKLGRAIKYKAFQTANFVQVEGSVMKWFATQGLKNLGKKTIMKSKGVVKSARLTGKNVMLKIRIFTDKDIRIKVKRTKPFRDVGDYFTQEWKADRIGGIVIADIPRRFNSIGEYTPHFTAFNVVKTAAGKRVMMIGRAEYYNPRWLNSNMRLGGVVSKGQHGAKNLIILDRRLFAKNSYILGQKVPPHAKYLVATHEALHYSMLKSKLYPNFLKYGAKYSGIDEFITLKGESLYKMGLLKFMAKEKAFGIKLAQGRTASLLLKRGVKPVQQPAFSIKLVNKGGRVKRYNLFKVNIGKKLYESAMTRKGRKFNQMYAVGKEQAGIMPKSVFKLSDWLKSQERGRILKSWARTNKKGEGRIFYQGKVYTLDELNYQLRHMREWESAHEMSRYAGGGVESNVNWAKVPDVLTGKKGSAVTGFKVPVVHANVGSASSLGIGSAGLGGLLWSQKSANGLSFKPANLSDLRIKQEQLRMSESAFDVSQRNKVEVVPVIIPKHDHLNIQKQDLGLEQLQIQELKLDFPRVPFSRGKYFKPKKWGGGFVGFEEPKKHKHYKGDSFWYFERKNPVMSGKAMMKMLFGGK